MSGPSLTRARTQGPPHPLGCGVLPTSSARPFCDTCYSLSYLPLGGPTTLRRNLKPKPTFLQGSATSERAPTWKSPTGRPLRASWLIRHTRTADLAAQPVSRTACEVPALADDENSELTALPANRAAHLRGAKYELSPRSRWWVQQLPDDRREAADPCRFRAGMGACTNLRR